LNFGIFANFGLLLLGTLLTDFPFFDGVRQPHGCSNDAENWVKTKFVEFEQWGRNLGGGAFLGFGPTPRKLTIASYSPGDLEKNGFVWAESAPIWGRYGGV